MSKVDWIHAHTHFSYRGFMSFVVEPLEIGHLGEIYAGSRGAEIACAAGQHREFWPDDMFGMNWARDRSRDAYLLMLPSAREANPWRYILGLCAGIALVEKTNYCSYRVCYASATFLHRSDEVEEVLSQAFAIAGEYLAGTASDELSRVPSLQLAWPEGWERLEAVFASSFRPPCDER